MKHVIALALTMMMSMGLSQAQIVSKQSGSWSTDSTWVGGAPPNASDDVVIAAGHTVTLDVKTAQCRNLTVSGGSATLRFAIDGTIAGLTVMGNVVINSGGKLMVVTRNPAGAANSYVEHTLTLYGNLTNNGILDLRGGSTSGGTSVGALTVFTGPANSTVSLMNTTYKSSAEEFNGITVNKSNGAKVILASGNLFMNSSSSVGPSLLTLTNGVIETGNNIFVTTSTNTNGIIGASDSSYISGFLGRGMNSTGETEKKFEIGDSAGYRPITIRTTTGGISSGHYVYAGLIKGGANPGNSSFTGAIDSVSRFRYYRVGYSKGGVTAASDTMAFKQFSPFYREDDGVTQNMLGLMVAYSTDGRAMWNGIGPGNHVADFSNPPTELQSDAVSPPIVLKDSASMYLSLAFGAGIQTGPLPDIPNGKYGPLAAHTFDFWKAKSDSPTPLIVRIHGGGLTSGSKSDYSQTFLDAVLAKGISFATINYRLSPEVVVPNHYLDCARAIQYFRLHAKELNIDPGKIGATGSSAGALTTFWLAFHDDLADPTNPDSVLRMSSRLNCVANWSGQTTVDKRVALAWIGPVVLDFTSYFAGTIFGVPKDSMDTPAAYALQEMASPATHLTKDDPAVWMYYSYVNPPANSSEAIHHVNFGVHLKQMMDSLGIESTLLTPSYTGSINDSAIDFFIKHFNEATTGVREKPMSVHEFHLDQNYPNPFNPTTKISFSLPAYGRVTVKVFDVLGKEVATLVNEAMGAGHYSAAWDAKDRASGMYYCQLRSGNFIETKKMLLIK